MRLIKATILTSLVILCLFSFFYNISYAIADSKDENVVVANPIRRGLEITEFENIGLNSYAESGPDEKSMIILLSFSLAVLVRLKMLNKIKKP